MTERPWVPMPIARGSRGAVVAPHHLATGAGLAILRAGGTAVDAAIAANAALGVVAPHHCGVGGDAFWLTWDAGTGRQRALNGSGRAGSRADAGMLRASGLASIPTVGPLSITVPGAVRSWRDMHGAAGRLDMATILAPAIELARDGFPAWHGFIEAVEDTARLVALGIGPTAGFFPTFRPQDRPWRPGERVRLPALASTLEALARDGLDGFYDGEVGDRQGRFLEDAGALVTRADLSAHGSTWGEPVGRSYRGVRVTSHPPNSSGVVALEILGILERFEPPPPTAFGRSGVADPRWIHLGIEAAKRAMADRDAHLTDPARIDVADDWWLDPGRLADVAAGIDPGRASQPAPSTNPIGGGTAFLGAVDAEGNAVSLIQSNYLGFGSGVVDPDTGVAYQDRGTYFSLDPGHPNRLEAGKRTLHTLLPGMLFRDGEPGPWVVAGSMGADAQPQIHAQFVSALVDGGVDLATAVGAPRWFVAPSAPFTPPDEVLLESRHEAPVAAALEAMGHRVGLVEPFDSALGHEHAIELVGGGPAADGGSLAAVTDPRSAGLPAVW